MYALHTSHITVGGTGYLGAAHAACIAELGLHVRGVDVDEAKISRLTAGEVPFHEPGLEATHPMLQASETLHDAVTGADVVVLATEWAGFRQLFPQVLSGKVAHRKIVDLRNVLDPRTWRSAGWSYAALGRS
jgi:UDP-glucose 6-dehydrogenase